MKELYARAMERSVQFLLCWIVLELIVSGSFILLFVFGYSGTGTFIAGLASFTIYAGLFIIVIPLVLAKLFEKQNCAEGKHSNRKELSNYRQIYCSPFSPIVIKIVERLKLNPQRCSKSENGNNTQTSCYQPEFSHIIQPFLYIVKRKYRDVNQNGTLPAAKQ
jgi:hypothetical protein